MEARARESSGARLTRSVVRYAKARRLSLVLLALQLALSLTLVYLIVTGEGVDREILALSGTALALGGVYIFVRARSFTRIADGLQVSMVELDADDKPRRTRTITIRRDPNTEMLRAIADAASSSRSSARIELASVEPASGNVPVSQLESLSKTHRGAS